MPAFSMILRGSFCTHCITSYSNLEALFTSVVALIRCSQQSLYLRGLYWWSRVKRWSTGWKSVQMLYLSKWSTPGHRMEFRSPTSQPIECAGTLACACLGPTCIPIAGSWVNGTTFPNRLIQASRMPNPRPFTERRYDVSTAYDV